VWLVTTNNDTADPNDGQTSLREAIGQSASGDGIAFGVTGGISLTGGELLITHSLQISGPGARNLAIWGRSHNRIFHINTTEPVAISGLALTGGYELGTQSQRDGSGGGIWNEGSALTLTDCAVTDNGVDGLSSSANTLGGFALGGGIRSSGPLTLRNCTVADNRATSGTGSQATANSYGGGIYCNAPLTLVNSTVAKNTADCPNTGSHSFGGGIYATQSPVVVACTIAANKGSAYDGADGAGIYVSGGTLSLRDTIVAQNTAANSAGSQESDVFASVTSEGYNLIGAREGSHTPTSNAFPWVATDKTGSTSTTTLDPQLGPLGNYGGPTDTCVVLDLSPAIDAGDDRVQSAPWSVKTDQRVAFPRRMGPHVDIGAFERDVAQPGPNFVVNILDDINDGVPGVQQCSLREAVTAANAGGGRSTITFKAGLTGTIFLRGFFAAVLKITSPVTISGPGARLLAVSGRYGGQLFNVTGEGVSISGLTLQDGFVPHARRLAAVDNGPDSAGGAIVNSGTLALDSCTFANNLAEGGYGQSGGNGGKGFGGALSNTGTVTLTACTLAGNQATGGDGDSAQATYGGFAYGGALYNNGTMELVNCTLGGNQAKGGSGGEPTYGGSPGLGGAIFNDTGNLSLLNCTLFSNASVGGLNGSAQQRVTQGGGLSRFGGTVNVQNSIIALNTATSNPDVYGSDYVSNGANLIGNRASSTGWTSTDKTGYYGALLDPGLGGLGSYGGPTDTCPLQAGSPAINAAKTSQAPVTDQRGNLRSGAPDIGAYEFNGPASFAPVNASLTPNSGGSESGAPRLFTAHYSDGNGASDLSYVYLLVNTSPNGSGGLWGYFDAIKNKLYLRNAANTAWLGGYAPGTSAAISDPQGPGSLDCARTSVSSSGNTLTVNWSFTPGPRWSGTTQNLYLYARDREGLEDGWDRVGTWSLSGAPRNGGVSPSSGSSRAGAARTLTATYSDPDGAADLSEARIYVSTDLDGAPALQGYYNVGANKLYLRNKANTAWLGGYAPGSSTAISEAGGAGSLNCAATQVTKNGTTLTITWTFTPAATFSGGKNLYLYVKDQANIADGWDAAGTWNVQ
jgi:CSLREA domain-containing protein